MSVTPDDIAAAARAWIGTPYRHQAATLGAGCDCLGLLRGVWRTLYGSEPPPLPPYRTDWRDVSHAGELLDLAERLLVGAEGEAQVGQVLLFRIGGTPLPRHCGILVAAGRFVHAQEKLGVIEANLTDGWRRRIARTFAFPQRDVVDRS
jgi:NlpC/P60 family putative phage cell wall peptidase